MDTVWTPSAGERRTIRKALLADLLPDHSPAARVEIFARAMGANSDAALTQQENAAPPSYPPTGEASRHLAHQTLAGHPLAAAVEGNVLARAHTVRPDSVPSSGSAHATQGSTQVPGWWIEGAETSLSDALQPHMPGFGTLLDRGAQGLHRLHHSLAPYVPPPEQGYGPAARFPLPEVTLPSVDLQAGMLRATQADLAWFHAEQWARALVPAHEKDTRVDRDLVRTLFVAGLLVDPFLAHQPTTPWRTAEMLLGFHAHKHPLPDLWKEAQKPWAYQVFDRLHHQVTCLAHHSTPFFAHDNTQRLSRSGHASWMLLQGLDEGKAIALPGPSSVP